MISIQKQVLLLSEFHFKEFSEYLINTNAIIQPKHYAVVRLSNDTLFKFAYQKPDGLNAEEQKRWGSDRKERNDCFDILNAWFSF